MSKTRLVLAAAVASLITLAGCGSDEPPKKQEPKKQSVGGKKPDFRPTEPLKPTGKPTVTADKLKSALTKVDLGSSDIGRGVSRMQHDDDLQQPTNDVCAREWPSNDARIARDQGYFYKKGSALDLVVSNEAVAYEPGTGEQVLPEVEQAIASCNGWKHEQGEMDNVHIVEPVAGALKESFAWEGLDRRKGANMHYTAIYQRNGDLVSVVYVWARDKNDLNEVAADVVPRAAERLQNAL